MPDQDIPSSPHQPDYKALQRASFGSVDEKKEVVVNHTVDGLFPNDAEDPKVAALKGLIKAFMSQKNEFGQSRYPAKFEVMAGVSEAIEKNPSLWTRHLSTG